MLWLLGIVHFVWFSREDINCLLSQLKRVEGRKVLTGGRHGDVLQWAAEPFREQDLTCAARPERAIPGSAPQRFAARRSAVAPVRQDNNGVINKLK